MVTPHTGGWIETYCAKKWLRQAPVTPHTGVWIETSAEVADCTVSQASRPIRACGLKQAICRVNRLDSEVTPHTGVWIETPKHQTRWFGVSVTLFTGVWIETGISIPLIQRKSRLRTGVWIETHRLKLAP